MAKTRIVLQPTARFDLPHHKIRSLSLNSLSHSPSPIPDSQAIIYLGTQSGSLLLLSLSRHESPDISIVKTVSVGVSPVESIFQLGTQPGKVLLLCDGFLLLVDSLLTQPPKRLGVPLKDISVVARRMRGPESQSTDLVPLENPADKSQNLFQRLGGGSRANGVRVKDFEGQQTRQSDYVFAVVMGKRLVLIELGLDNRNEVDGSFVLLKEIQCIDGIKTMAWLDDSIIVGTVAGYTLFSCVTGQNGAVCSLQEASGPPFLTLLRKEWKVLLLVDNVGVVVDANGQPVGGSLAFCRRPDSLGELSLYLVAAADGKLELYHRRRGSCTQTTTFGVGGGGRCIVADDETGSGKLVAAANPTKLTLFQQVPCEEQMKDLLRKRNFREAISLLEELESESEILKETVSFVHAQIGFLLLFDLRFEEAVDQFLQSETMEPSEVFPFILRDPNRWSLLIPRNRYWGLHPPPVPLEDVVDDGLTAIQRAVFLKKAGIETPVDDDFLSNPPSRASLLESAIKNVTRYLEVSRQKNLTLAVREGIDTLLMYLYRALNRVDDMEKLASTDNNCVVEELETLLEESGHLRTLAFLYASKGMDAKALAIWRVFARNYWSGLWRESSLETDLHDGKSVASSGKEAAAAEASKILEASADQDLVLQHLTWIADVNQVLAVRILISEKRTEQLSPEEVIAAIDPKKVEILQRYLQWLIEYQDCSDSHFHTLYALLLAKSALESFEIGSGSLDSNSQRLGAKDTNAGTSSIFQDSVRDRLQSFLQSSDLYDPEEVLDLIEGSELWLEKAILYRKLGQETLVLQILALKLKDSDAAEQYCAEIGRPDAYMQLLEMYLDPQEEKEPMFNAAVRLLHNHGESLDPLQVLEKLSPDMPLQLASDTILRMLRARVHHHRQGLIVHNLYRAVNVDTRLARLEERSRHVQINDESLCDSCHARLGTKLFAMYPDDTIVCYKCFRRLGGSTSVKGRDFKRDVLIKPGWLTSR